VNKTGEEEIGQGKVVIITMNTGLAKDTITDMANSLARVTTTTTITITITTTGTALTMTMAAEVPMATVPLSIQATETGPAKTTDHAQDPQTETKNHHTESTAQQTPAQDRNATSTKQSGRLSKKTNAHHV
jgi:hypothetical protein